MADTRIKVVFGNERIIPATGLGVVGGILGRSNFRKRADRKPVNPKLNTELREGKQHSQAHTPEFLKETLDMAHQLTDAQLLIRLDSGNDAAENYGRSS